MISSLRKSLLAVAALASLATAGLATPAAAQWYGGRDRGGWEDGRGDWGRDRGDWGRRPHWHRERCWVETRPVRVMTPWGPRIRHVEQRVCR